MILALIAALLLGILAGTFTGLSPGIHINLVASFILLSLGKFSSLEIPMLALSVFIVAMSITHTFIDFIPSIYLGAPEGDNFLSILPGHQLLKEGKGHEAFVLTAYGSLIAIPIIIIITPIFILFLPSLFAAIKTIIPFLLLLASLFIIFREKEFLASLIVFLLAGFLGFATFALPVKEPLLPLLSGLFGLSSLLVSLKTNAKINKQIISPLKKIKLASSELFKTSLVSAIAAPLCSFLPGIGAGHAAVLGSEMIKQTNRKFLFLLGAINTIVMGLSFVTAYTIGKTRTGSAAAVLSLLKKITPYDLTIILIAIALSGVAAFFLGIILSKFAAKNINKIPYAKLNILVIGILVFVNVVFTNWLGIIVLITAAALGVFAVLSNSKRINLMSSLIVPAIIYYLL
ncbi:MAG: tripartite tricarboxylate transporter permease [Nanoarchaeota archaeon]